MTTNQIRFVPGKFDRYISTRSFQLGATGQGVLDGMEILFDGTNVELNGSKFVLPTLRGAIKLGWLVRAEDYDPEAPLQPTLSAGIGVRSANDLGQNPLSPARKSTLVTVESDERVVMSRQDRNSQVTQKNNDRMRQAGAFVARGGALEVGGSEFGVPVQREFKTPAKDRLEITPNNVGSAIREAETVSVQPGQGVTEQDLLARMDDAEREKYLAEKESRKADIMSRAPGYIPPPAVTTNLAIINNQSLHQRQAVRQVTSSQQPKIREGVSVGITVGGGTEVFDASGTEQKPLESVANSEGITFRNTNGPKRVLPLVQSNQDAAPASAEPSTGYQEDVQSKIDRDGTADARRKIAKAVCSDFPEEYNFSDHWKRRLAMIRLNYEDRLDVIRAIFAAESDDFKRVIVEEFPGAFQS